MKIYPKLEWAYVMEGKERNKYIKQIVMFIRKKKLPKGLEVSIIEEILEVLKNSPEHEYKRKYDTQFSSHPYFY